MLMFAAHITAGEHTIQLISYTCIFWVLEGDLTFFDALPIHSILPTTDIGTALQHVEESKDLQACCARL